MLQPKRTKFRKQFKGSIKGEAKGGSDLNFGTYGLKAIQPERVTARQIEAARRAILRCQSGGYQLPADKYEQWKDVVITFDPSGMRLR